MSTCPPPPTTPPPPASQKLPPDQALVRAKQRLAEISDATPPSSDAAQKAFINAVSHKPYAAAGAALAVGAAVGYFPPLRKLLLVAVGWGAKRAFNQYIRSCAARRRK